MNSIQKKKKKEQGMIVVEATMSFTIFLLVLFIIIYFINIFMIHNKIQFAINSVAHEIASYSYLYEATSIRSANQQIQEDGNPYASKVDETVTQVSDSFNQVQELYSNFGNAISAAQNVELNSSSIKNIYNQFTQLKSETGTTIESVKGSIDSVKGLLSDPDGLIAGIIYIGVSEVDYGIKNLIGAAAATALTEKYLKSAQKSADEYLKGYGVINGYKGLDFSASTLFCDEHMRVVDIVVEYDIDLRFAKLFIPTQKLSVVQRVCVPAWLNGDGQQVPE